MPPDPKPNRKIAKAIIALSGFALLLTAGWLYNPLPANPPAAELSQAAKAYSVEVVRDQWGVPYIFGKRDTDVAYGLAYAHAEDDFETIQETLAVTRGKLAHYRGSAGAPADYSVSLFDIWGTLEARYENDVPNDVKALAEAYVAGLNLYAAEHPDKTWRGLAPFTAKDVLAGFMFKTPLFYGLDKELAKLFDPERKAEIALSSGVKQTTWQLVKPTGAELGSNGLAVNRIRSGDNKVRLLINSHQPMTGPVAWYEAHLHSQESLKISGGLFPGTPVILNGFNRNLGWANTVNHIDLSDSYILTRNPANEQQYRLDGQWRDFEVEEVTIMVRLFGPFAFPAKRRVLRSAHGPVIEGDRATFALRYAGMGEIRQLEQYYRLNQASNFEEFSSAMAMNALPSINYIYADKDDNIGFIHNAQYPKRVEGWEWQKDLPGDRSDLIWQGYHPYSKIPKLVNPKSGFVFNANNTPFSATDGPDNLRVEDFPTSMGLAQNQTNRALRLIELNDGATPISEDAIMRLKFDTRYSEKSEHVALIKQFLALDASDNAKLKAALDHLNKWNYSTDKQNRQAALAILAMRLIFRGDNPDDRSPETLRHALSKAQAWLNNRFDSLDVPWGEVNRLKRGKLNLALSGGPDILRAIYSIGVPEDQLPHATHGDTWIALVEWDQQGRQSALVAHQFGSATLDKTSPHYADQAPLFSEQKWRTALLTENEIRANATRVYRPGLDEPQKHE